jgi:tetratricopeptide (TPR) repeat protein
MICALVSNSLTESRSKTVIGVHLCHNVAAMKCCGRILFLSFATTLVFTTLSKAQSAAGPAPAKASDAAELVKQGRALSNEGKLDEALALFHEALQQDPASYQAEMAIGMTLDVKGQYAQAREHLQKAIQEAPERARAGALRTMAVSYAFQSNVAEAAKYEQQAFDMQLGAQKFSDAAGTANELARIYIEAGDVDDAYKWYEKGYETALRDPKLSDADKNLWLFRWENAQARIAARRGQGAEAQKHVARAKAALDKANNPDQARYWPYLTGYVAFYGGDYETAIRDLQQADQQDPFILVLLAQAYEKSGDQPKAMDYYRKVLAVYVHTPTNAFARPLAEKKVRGAAS